jgi:hypothetical protein
MLEGTTLWIAAVSNPCNLKARHVMRVAEGLRMSADALARACSLSPPSKEVRWRMAFSTISREDDNITGYETICGTARREYPARLHAQRRTHKRAVWRIHTVALPREHAARAHTGEGDAEGGIKRTMSNTSESFTTARKPPEPYAARASGASDGDAVVGGEQRGFCRSSLP